MTESFQYVFSCGCYSYLGKLLHCAGHKHLPMSEPVTAHNYHEQYKLVMYADREQYESDYLRDMDKDYAEALFDNREQAINAYKNCPVNTASLYFSTSLGTWEGCSDLRVNSRPSWLKNITIRQVSIKQKPVTQGFPISLFVEIPQDVPLRKLMLALAEIKLNTPVLVDGYQGRLFVQELECMGVSVKFTRLDHVNQPE